MIAGQDLPPIPSSKGVLRPLRRVGVRPDALRSLDIPFRWSQPKLPKETKTQAAGTVTLLGGRQVGLREVDPFWAVQASRITMARGLTRAWAQRPSRTVAQSGKAQIHLPSPASPPSR